MAATFGVFIGRFQPFHEGHQFLVAEALKEFEQLIIVIGSAFRARSMVNPFTYAERVSLIQANLGKLNSRVQFVPVEDVFYDETYWCDLVKMRVTEITADAPVTLLGHDKDASTYYLQEFPLWNYRELPNFKGVNATPLRQQYLLEGLIDTSFFSAATQDFLQIFKNSDDYAWLHREAKFVNNYKASWASAPYPPIFVTTDSVVICKGHILLIERKFHPGLGLYALPGGFIEPGEWVVTGLIRELVEETQIALELDDIEAALVKLEVFDYPGRSQIGRVITHAGLFKLADEVLPAVMGNDDAGRAFWLPLEDFFRAGERLHDDHLQIVQHWQRQGLLI